MAKRYLEFRELIDTISDDMLDGSIDNAIDTLQKHKAEWESQGYFNITMILDVDSYDATYEITGTRKETDDERDERLRKAREERKQEKERRRRFEEQEEERRLENIRDEKALYLRLKEKYGD